MGYDAAKKVNGRKRHAVVDTLGLMLGCAILPGNVQDRVGCLGVLTAVRRLFPFLERVIADGAYQGQETARAVRRAARARAIPTFTDPVELLRRRARSFVWFRLNWKRSNHRQGGLILDVVIEAGNPADSDRLMPMLERHISAYGAAPLQAAADGGYASRKNLDRAKACGVRDMAFHKKSGLSIEDMVRSRWVYRRLRNFRAGIEAGISCLKRAYGLARCMWRGLDHFKGSGSLNSEA